MFVNNMLEMIRKYNTPTEALQYHALFSTIVEIEIEIEISNGYVETNRNGLQRRRRWRS